MNMRKYKIAFVGTEFESIPPRKTGGAGKAIFTLAKELSPDHEVHIYSIMSNTLEYYKDIYFHYYSVKHKIFKAVFFHFKVIKDIKNRDFDIVHFHRSIGGLFCKLFRVKAKKIRHFQGDILPYMRYHFFTLGGIKDNIYVFLNKLGNRCFDCFISVSHYILNQIKSKYPTVPNFLLYNTCSPDLYRPHEGERSSYRKDLNIEEDEIIVLYAGRIMLKKGIETLIEAFNLLKEKKVKLIIAGAPYELRFTKEIKNIMTIIKSENKIIYLGELGEKDLIKAYNCADVVCIPSRWQEPFGLVAVEAMMIGKPVIATKRGGLPEVITDESVGKLCNPLSVFELCNCIEGMVNRIMSYNSNKIREYAIRRFSSSSMKKEYIKILDEIMK
jgi:glycosyltransferase involved in cell wall biosynthesis